jgi:hypothetical protein
MSPPATTTEPVGMSGAARPGRRWLAPLLRAAVIVLAGCWVFAPAFHGGWLWDDRSEILENQDVRGPGGLAKLWSAPASPDYFPLKTSLQWVEWRLWGDATTTGYHLVSVALHLLGALLFWRLLR